MKAFGKRQVAVYFGSVVLSALGLALVVWVCTSSIYPAYFRPYRALAQIHLRDKRYHKRTPHAKAKDHNYRRL